ncbi:ROK family transcriptional regulator [Actinophytocola sp.]|uniref:ROK family transcriptional regulator n=1 Tax=Actinophytocola sp. TaxID=1872138 RepID=UPI00389ABEFA
MNDRGRDAPFDARTLLTSRTDSLREANRRRIIRAVMVTPGTQVSIARQTHLSQATISAVVNELVQEGVFVVDSGEGERGKRVRLGPVRGAAVGVEVNHSSVTVAARPVGAADVEYSTVEFGADQSGNLWFRRAVRLIRETVERTGLTSDHIVSIGVGIPAAIDPRTSRITQVSSSLGWNMTGDPRDQFQHEFSNVPVIVDNEANLAAYGEYVHGVGLDGHETMLYVKASVGIGAGLIVGGLIFRGRHGIAGEMGHLAMDTDGTVCRCGNRGCLETLIGGIRLLSQVREAYAGYRIDSPQSLESLIERAKGGDPVCRRVLTDAARVMGLALAKVCNLLNPEIVVLGGELGMAADLLLTVIEDSMRLHALRGMFDPEFAPVRVVGSELGRQAGARGALSFALQVDQTIPA